jgi:glycosyltransferase involved in cell wall biosynthesis/GT2 family glycosyltransferase
VTVVTPFYNQSEIFHETARSLLQQSLQQFEWIIVNDGTTEPRSLDVVARYREGDRRIRVIDHARNKGIGAARNSGFRLANTPYVVTLDSDDMLERTALEKWLWFLDAHPDFAFVNAYQVIFGGQQRLVPRGFQDGVANLTENFIPQTTMIRASVHRAIGGYVESPFFAGYEDWDFWMRAASMGHWGQTLSEYLIWYRKRLDADDPWDFLNRTPHIVHALRKKYPSLWRGGLPHIDRGGSTSDEPPDGYPCANRLVKSTRRLLMVIPYMTLGGSEKFNLDVARGLRSRGWELTIATTDANDDPWLCDFACATPDIFRLHEFLRPSDFPRFLSYLIDSRRPDAVFVSNSECCYHLLPYLQSRHEDVAFVDFCHMDDDHWDGGYPRFSVQFKDALDVTMVSSEHLRQWMATREPKKTRVDVIYTGAEPIPAAERAATRSAIRHAAGVSQQTAVILYACRITPQKQPRVFAEVIRNLASREKDFVAWVAGDGRDLPWLESYVRSHGLERYVRFHGPVSVDQMRELILAADVFFLPSEWEGISLGLYEAMAAGCAVVAADVGGQRELVAPGTGILVGRSSESDEVEQYTALIAELLDQPSRREELGMEARRRTTEVFPIDRTIDGVAACLESAIENHVTTAGAYEHDAVMAHALTAVRLAAQQAKAAHASEPPRPRPVERHYRTFTRVAGPLYRVAMRWSWVKRLRDFAAGRLGIESPRGGL